MEIAMKRSFLVTIVVAGIAVQLAGCAIQDQRKSISTDEQAVPSLQEQELSLQMYAGGLDL
jgi:hypothetical protein